MPFILDFAPEDLGGEEVELEVRGGSGGGGEEGGGDFPGGVALLELDEPLVGGDAVGGVRVVVEDMDGLGHLHLDLLIHPPPPLLDRRMDGECCFCFPRSWGIGRLIGVRVKKNWESGRGSVVLSLC